MAKVVVPAGESKTGELLMGACLGNALVAMVIIPTGESTTGDLLGVFSGSDLVTTIVVPAGELMACELLAAFSASDVVAKVLVTAGESMALELLTVFSASELGKARSFPLRDWVAVVGLAGDGELSNSSSATFDPNGSNSGGFSSALHNDEIEFHIWSLHARTSRILLTLGLE